MKERIPSAFTKKKILHFVKMVLFVVALSLILLSLLGTVAHATGLVDDTINAENLYSKYPLSNYQLDFYVDNSWSWLPWNWLDGIGKSVQYGLYCITNFVWTISLYLISGYLTKELQDLNIDTIRTDIPTNSTVTDVIVWSIEQSGTDTFSATYEVDQQIKEGEQTSNVKATYTVKVHVDADGDMVIVQNPTLAPAIEKSDYEPKTPEADTSVDADTVNDATAFLETFFKLYPTATEKELAYYVSGNVIEPIGRDYLYSELVNPVFTKDGDNVKVKVAVKFLDNQTKATQVSQYELVLQKDSNWKIVG